MTNVTCDDCPDSIECVHCGDNACYTHDDAVNCPDQDGVMHFECHYVACAQCAAEDEAERRGDAMRNGDDY